MFELWFGPRLARFEIPTFTVIAVAGLTLVIVRPPDSKLPDCDGPFSVPLTSPGPATVVEEGRRD